MSIEDFKHECYEWAIRSGLNSFTKNPILFESKSSRSASIYYRKEVTRLEKK